MGDKKVWFGTKERMEWVPAPLPGVDRSAKKWRASGQFLNGGAWQTESAVGARAPQLTWPPMPAADVRKIRAFLEGTYGLGPFYYSDPFAEPVNVLPQWLATPWLATEGGPSLRGSVKPSKVTTPTNTYDYPTYGAQYPVSGLGERIVSVPVPAGFTAHLGVHGEVVSGTATVRANSTDLTLLGVNTATLTNFTMAGPGFVDLRLYSGTSGVLKLYGLVLRLLPTGQPAPTGPFVPGDGHSGLKLDGDPQITGYSSALDSQAITANFVEAEAWQ